jgi:hypothetical protein
MDKNKAVVGGQILITNNETKVIADDYLSGKTTLDDAVARMPKAKSGLLDKVLKVVLPEDLYQKSRA